MCRCKILLKQVCLTLSACYMVHPCSRGKMVRHDDKVTITSVEISQQDSLKYWFLSLWCTENSGSGKLWLGEGESSLVKVSAEGLNEYRYQVPWNSCEGNHEFHPKIWRLKSLQIVSSRWFYSEGSSRWFYSEGSNHKKGCLIQDSYHRPRLGLVSVTA
jgi:hypothetical protein